jgi:hypothetical protein
VFSLLASFIAGQTDKTRQAFPSRLTVNLAEELVGLSFWEIRRGGRWSDSQVVVALPPGGRLSGRLFGPIRGLDSGRFSTAIKVCDGPWQFSGYPH